MTLYQDLAARLNQRIRNGTYQAGDRLPGIRRLSRDEGTSNATVVAAYRQLEFEGRIEARPRSGYFVRPQPTRLPEPESSHPGCGPRAVTGQALVLQMLKSISEPHVVQLGANLPDTCHLPTASLRRVLAAAARAPNAHASRFELPPGLPELRKGIARRMAVAGASVHPEHIMITAGCQEALYLSLKSVTAPGDVVAIESPTYYGLLQIIDALGLRALEITTDPTHGLSVPALEKATARWPIKACVVMPNFSNPLGSRMPDAARSDLLALAAAHPDLTLIEDDIYGDLYFGPRRPGTLIGQADANVIYCSSFSKTLAPGLRLGWTASRRHNERLHYEKFAANCATSTVEQLAVARLLDSTAFDRHLRGFRAEMARAVARMSDRVSRSFPAGTRIARPQGGSALWLELPGTVNTSALAHNALQAGISFAPGAMFSPTGRYTHCLRLNCGVQWTPAVEDALTRLGRMCS